MTCKGAGQARSLAVETEEQTQAQLPPFWAPQVGVSASPSPHVAGCSFSLSREARGGRGLAELSGRSEPCCGCAEGRLGLGWAARVALLGETGNLTFPE